jgi:hypothetical protein
MSHDVMKGGVRRHGVEALNGKPEEGTQSTTAKTYAVSRNPGAMQRVGKFF